MTSSNPSTTTPPTFLRRFLNTLLGSTNSTTPTTTPRTTNRLHLRGDCATWLHRKAADHNCGSLNKTFRDLLSFYSTLPTSHLEQLLQAGRSTRSSTESRTSTEVGQVDVGDVKLTLTGEHREWLKNWCVTLGEEDRERVVELLVQVAMRELDGEVIFEGNGLAKSTEALYADLGIFTELMEPEGLHR